MARIGIGVALVLLAFTTSALALVPIPDILREPCRVLAERVTRVVQDSPQRVEEVETYEWCTDPPLMWLVKRTFYRVDGRVSTRNPRSDTPASRVVLLWEWTREK